MQAAFKSSVEKDVCCLREVLAQYKEHNERLEMQKKLLLNQVSRLGMRKGLPASAAHICCVYSPVHKPCHMDFAVAIL
jgi:hypothetical protein